MVKTGIYIDRDVEDNGTPRWFNFVATGPHVPYTEGALQAAGRIVECDWPLPQQLRIKVYARMAARGEDFED